METKVYARSTARFLSGTLLSRITGMFRDISMAVFFGVTPILAAFMVSFRFANILRRIFAETPLSASFIPPFEQAKLESKKNGAKFYLDFLLSLSLVVLVVIALLEIFLLLFPKFLTISEGSRHILRLTSIMLPGLFFIVVSGLNNAFLQCEKKFFLSGLSPAGFNLIWIIAVFALQKTDQFLAVTLLSFAILLAFMAQAMITMPSVFSFLRNHLKDGGWKSCRPFSCDVKKAIGPFCISILGIGASQINSGLDAIFARVTSLEGPAFLWYAIRLYQLPIAFFGVSLAAVFLPPLSRAYKAGEVTKYNKLFRYLTSLGICFSIPSMFALFSLGSPLISLLFGYGKFSSMDAAFTYNCVFGYAIGLLPSIMILILAPCFFAKEDYKTPLKATLIGVCVNITLNSFFVFAMHLGAFSIALSTSIAAFFQMGYLLWKLALNKKTNNISVTFLGKVSLASIISSLLVFVVENQVMQSAFSWRDSPFILKLGVFSFLAILFATVFFLVSKSLGLQEVFDLLPSRKINMSKE